MKVTWRSEIWNGTVKSSLNSERRDASNLSFWFNVSIICVGKANNLSWAVSQANAVDRQTQRNERFQISTSKSMSKREQRTKMYKKFKRPINQERLGSKVRQHGRSDWLDDIVLRTKTRTIEPALTD